jgi:hypothetical protein
MTGTALWAALLFQAEAILEKAEAASREGGDFTVRVTAEIEDKVDESRVSASGTLSFGAAERTLLVEWREARPGARVLRTTLRDGGPFHPFELWRRGAGRWLLERFEVAPAAGPGELPAGVAGLDGASLPARRARLPARRKAYDRSAPEGTEEGARPVVLDLVPREESLQRKFLSLQLHLDPESYRVLRLVVDTPRQKTTYAPVDGREDGR